MQEESIVYGVATIQSLLLLKIQFK